MHFKDRLGLGQVGRPSDAGGGKNAREMAELTNAIQRFFIENSRLGTPVVFHEECLHGHAATNKPHEIRISRKPCYASRSALRRFIMRAAALTESLLIVALFAGSVGGDVFAIGQARYVERVNARGSFPIVQGNSAATTYVDSKDWPGVIRAVNDLQADIVRVTARKAAIHHDASNLGRNAIIIGTIGKSRIIDDLVRTGKIDASQIAGKWESFFLQVVPNPLSHVSMGLVIVGSDKRGTIYGIYDLSEQMGVSPWYWWADVPVQPQKALFVKAGKYQQGEPSVKYRGIFLNDEAPACAFRTM